MQQDQLKETLLAIGRHPCGFRRDTPQLLKALENIEQINKNLKSLENSVMGRNQAE